MPRHFDRTADDYILFSPGTLTNATGAVTVAVIWYTTSTSQDQGLVRAEDSVNTQVFGFNNSVDSFLYWAQGGFTQVQAYTANEWRLDAVTRPAGAAQTVRGHAYTYAGTTWAHTNYGTVNDSTASPVDHLYLGRLTSTVDLTGEIAVVGIWKSVLSDGQLETLPNALSAWTALSPDALWVLNQTSIATPVPDSTTHGANQSGISGTTVSSFDVPGFDYGGLRAVPSFQIRRSAPHFVR